MLLLNAWSGTIEMRWFSRTRRYDRRSKRAKLSFHRLLTFVFEPSVLLPLFSICKVREKARPHRSQFARVSSGPLLFWTWHVTLCGPRRPAPHDACQSLVSSITAKRSLSLFIVSTRNKCIASSNKRLTSSNKKLLELSLSRIYIEFIRT